MTSGCAVEWSDRVRHLVAPLLRPHRSCAVRAAPKPKHLGLSVPGCRARRRYAGHSGCRVRSLHRLCHSGAFTSAEMSRNASDACPRSRTLCPRWGGHRARRVQSRQWNRRNRSRSMRRRRATACESPWSCRSARRSLGDHFHYWLCGMKCGTVAANAVPALYRPPPKRIIAVCWLAPGRPLR